jgi:hypothetical protein
MSKLPVTRGSPNADPRYSRLVLVSLKLVPKVPNEVPVVGLEQSAWPSGGITEVQHNTHNNYYCLFSYYYFVDYQVYLSILPGVIISNPPQALITTVQFI